MGPDQKIENTESKKDSGLNRCPYCGSTDVVLNPKTGKLRCNYCRSEFDAETVNGPDDIRALNGETIGSGATDIIPDVKVVLSFKCSACGSSVVIDTNEATSARCHWCRHSLSVNEQVPNGAVPDMVLPFKMEKTVAENKIKAFVDKRQFFANPKFKKEFTSTNVMGVYLPYVIADVNGRMKMTGQAERTTRKYTRGSGEHRRTYYDADLYNVEREFDLLVDDLTVEASKDKLNQNILVNTSNVINAIMPFDVENSVGWDANYLRGFASEKRDTNVGDLRGQMGLQVKDVARFKMNEDMGFYDRGTRWDVENLDVKGAKMKTAYLPVWLYSYLEEEKGKKLLHYCAVNARTGETMGSVPIHKKKLMSAAIGVEILGIIFGAVWFWGWMHVDMDDNPAFLALVGLTPGFIYYWIMKNRYRNMSARHYHESETKATVENLKRNDVIVKNMKELRNSTMTGANNRTVSGTVAKGGGKMMGEQMAEALGIGKMLIK